MNHDTPQKSIHELDLSCPTLPRTLLEAMELAQNPDGPDLDKVTELVHHDPAVAARVLRVVNSAYYGRRGQIESARRAVVVLGPSSILGITMSMSMMEMRASLDAKTAGPFLNLVRHSIATSYLARHLILADPTESEDHRFSKELTSEVFTAAIMHDFGKVILLYNFPDEAVSFYEAPLASDQDILLAETERFGFNHVDTGINLSRRLNLPNSLLDVIALHHDLHGIEKEEKGVQKKVLSVVAGNLVANALGYTVNHILSWEQCCAHPLWEHIIGTGLFGYTSPAEMQNAAYEAREDLAAYVDAVI